MPGPYQGWKSPVVYLQLLKWLPPLNIKDPEMAGMVNLKMYSIMFKIIRQSLTFENTLSGANQNSRKTSLLKPGKVRFT